LNRRTIQILVTVLAVASLAPLLPSCGSSETVAVSTTFLSSTLATRSDFATSGCDTTSTTFAACITPTSVTGKAYYSGMIVGTTNGLSLGPMIGTVEDPSKATAFSESELLDIDLGTQIKNTGSPTLGGPIPYPADAEAYVQNFHVYFGWFDVTFTLAGGNPNGAVDGTHVFRQVMADITGTEMKKGDVMYKASGDTTFKWCTTAGCAHDTRPTSPIQNSAIANFSSTNEGNKTIPSFFMAPPTGATPVQITKTDLTSKTSQNLFTVDVTFTKGIKFATNGALWTTPDKIAADLRFAAEPGSSTGGFTAAITYTK